MTRDSDGYHGKIRCESGERERTDIGASPVDNESAQSYTVFYGVSIRVGSLVSKDEVI